MAVGALRTRSTRWLAWSVEYSPVDGLVLKRWQDNQFDIIPRNKERALQLTQDSHISSAYFGITIDIDDSPVECLRSAEHLHELVALLRTCLFHSFYPHTETEIDIDYNICPRRAQKYVWVHTKRTLTYVARGRRRCCDRSSCRWGEGV
jgi:hypothetical protein